MPPVNVVQGSLGEVDTSGGIVGGQVERLGRESDPVGPKVSSKELDDRWTLDLSLGAKPLQKVHEDTRLSERRQTYAGSPP
jgi:hypothetical protein